MKRKKKNADKEQGIIKTCFDCLNCKVSTQSIPGNRLCYCSVTPNKKLHNDAFWLSRKLCNRFDDMSVDPVPVSPVINPQRRRLLAGTPFFRRNNRLFSIKGYC